MDTDKSAFTWTTILGQRQNDESLSLRINLTMVLSPGDFKVGVWLGPV